MRTTRLGVLVTAALLISGCGPVEAEGVVHIYKRNASADLGLVVESAHHRAWTRVESDSRGCSAVSLPWTISIGAANRDGPVGEYHQLLSSADVADPTNAEIWIDVAQDGSVSWGEGRPDWDGHGTGGCGP